MVFHQKIYKPVLMGEEWTYRDKALVLLDRSSDLLDQYSKTINEYLDGTIDQVTLRFRRFDYYSSIKIIDGEAHRLTALEEYEDFHDHFMGGIHLVYNIMFYHSMNESDIDAAVNEITYAKSIMPEAKTPKPTDTSLFVKIITFVGVIAPVALASPFHIMLWVNVPLTVVSVVCNFLDWNAASALTNIPCDWNVFFIATAKASLLNLSLIVFLVTLLTNQTTTRITPLRKLGVPGLLFINFLFTIWFISFNFSDFNSLLQIFSSSTGDDAYQSWQFFSTFFVFKYIFGTGDLRELWKGFVNLSMITFLATAALNFYMLKRVKQ
ncbi:MAG: hypothetical protein QMD13_01835 [Candidatus Bathyarchaeia archaeon]|nr:hypothetical protein [Candidatus Bathyarchaeia archaeon]